MECGKSQILKHECTVGHQEKVDILEKLTSYRILSQSNSSNIAAQLSDSDSDSDFSDCSAYKIFVREVCVKNKSLYLM